MASLLTVLPAVLAMLMPLLVARPSQAAPPAESPPASAAVDYELSLSFALGEGSGSLTGTAKITVPPGSPLTLALPRLTVTGTLLREENGRESHLQPQAERLVLSAAPDERTLFISYRKSDSDDPENIIGPAGIALLSDWYPVPDRPMRYRLTATLPGNFSAITEADTFPLPRLPAGDSSATYQATFARPTGGIHFVAGPYTIHKRQVRENLFVYAMFFAEDEDLADGYLQAAAGYLNRYEREIGPYPYHHYVIVANRRPTGLGMPTFTLLGQAVLRLPFITATSLGHEIAHSWFGNGVEVDYRRGNWCEGLTSFIADRAFREERGEGVADRQESITRYLSYVHEDTAIPLAEFTSASHEQAMAQARRAVGYDRGALLFHELRETIGRPAFARGLRQFYADYNGRSAGWPELEKSFAEAADSDLSRFFTERLTRRDIPDLAVQDIAITTDNHHPVLAFTLRQRTAEPYALTVPVRLTTMAGDETILLTTAEAAKKIAIPLSQRPLAFTLDPDHDLLRQLDREEYPPVWSRFMGSANRLAVLGQEDDRELFQGLLDSLGEQLTVRTGDQVTDQELAEHDLLFLGAGQPRARALFGPPAARGAEDPDFTLDVRRNPLDIGRVAVLVASRGRDETAAAARLLSHYGKYSFLGFTGGRNTVKATQPTSSGLRFVLEDLPQGGAARDLDSFAAIVDKLAAAQVVYVGETHTDLADHLLQLRLIEALYRRDPRLAIGMEMFPAGAQAVLDRYTRGQDDDERRFLKESDYYNVWRYDWRYYRDIVNFAKTKGLPVIGLNLDRRIVAEVFRTGGTDSLTPEERATLPPDRDLDLAGYPERLAEVHAAHIEGSHGSGGMSGFIQAQGLWDETMAANVAGYLEKNPDWHLVVLAGSQHARKDSGIPPRVARRLPVAQATVMNVAADRSPLDLDLLTDYYFHALPADLPDVPRIGVVLVSETEDGRTCLKIDQFSPHGKAEAAGLLPGDIVTGIGGVAVTEMADVHIAMLDSQPGDTVEVRVRRTVDGQEQSLAFPVELTASPPSAPHP